MPLEAPELSIPAAQPAARRGGRPSARAFALRTSPLLNVFGKLVNASSKMLGPIGALLNAFGSVPIALDLLPIALVLERPRDRPRTLAARFDWNTRCTTSLPVVASETAT